MKIKKNRKILLILGVLALLLAGSTVAYFQSSDSIDNQFQNAEAKVYINEKFNPNDRWVPGEEKQKEVQFGNEGKIAAVLRIKFTPVLKLQDGTENETTKEAAQDFELNFAEDFKNNWTQKDDWYYYNKVLSPNQLTGITLKSVTVSDRIGNDEHGITTDYSEASYDVKIEGELLQASLASEAAEYMKWGLSPTVTGQKVRWQ